MLLKEIICFGACLALTACATAPAEPKVRVVEVKVPVAVSCVPKSLGGAPDYPDSDAAINAAPGSGDMLQLLAAGRLLRNQRLAEIEPVLAGCRSAAP